MIYKIQPFEIPNVGIATELKLEIQTRFTTPERAIIYYDLRDPNETDTAFDSRTKESITIPYKILFYNKIIVTGTDRELILNDKNEIVNIFKKERGDIILK